MLNLAKLNGITATIVACVNCGMPVAKIADKLVAKYGMDRATAGVLVNAIMSVV